jgi:hypothetical protein
MEGVDNLLGDNNIGRYVSIFNKGSLSRINGIRKDSFEPVSKRFSYDFIDDIA